MTGGGKTAGDTHNKACICQTKVRAANASRARSLYEGTARHNKTVESMNHQAWAAHQAVSDSQFLQQFEQATLPAALFDHLGHLRAAFLFLERESVILAQRHFANAIQRYADALGKPEKFHMTITYALLAVMAARQGVQRCPDWSAFIAANPDLLSDARALLLSYYSADMLASDKARQQFVLPDKTSLASLLAAS